VNLENVKQFPVIVELTDKKEKYNFLMCQKAKYKSILTSLSLIFTHFASFMMKIKTELWDAGNFLEKRQSEEVIYFPKDIDVRANWDVQQTFSLK